MYTIRHMDDDTYRCSCPSFLFNERKSGVCKHIVELKEKLEEPIIMTKAEQIIKQLEAELEAYTRQTETMDMSKVQHPVKWFARLSFYNAQAFKKVFERLDEIEAQIKK